LLKRSSIGFVHHEELDADLDVADGIPASTLRERGLDSGGYSSERDEEEKGRLYTAGICKRITVFGVITRLR